MPTDGYRIKLTDQRVRPGRSNLNYTVCEFRYVAHRWDDGDSGVTDARGKRIYTQPGSIEAFWHVDPKPISKRQEQRHAALLAEGDSAVYRYGSGPGRRRGEWFEVPDLDFVLRWERLIPILDRLAEAGAATCTIDQLRWIVQRS